MINKNILYYWLIINFFGQVDSKSKNIYYKIENEGI